MLKCRIISENLSNDNLQSVEELDFSYIKQISISGTGFQPFPQLKILNLTDASILSVGENWFGARNVLQVLDLRRNQLESLDRNSVLHLNLLRELYLDDNSIAFTEDMAFVNSSLLRRLSFRYNRIQTLSNLGVLPLLDTLDYSLNSITTVRGRR